jgi:hypothetical protein
VDSRGAYVTGTVGPVPELSAYESILDFLVGDSLALVNDGLNPITRRYLMPNEKLDAKVLALVSIAPLGGVAVGAISRSGSRAAPARVREAFRHGVFGALRGLYNNVAGRLRGDFVTRVEVPRGVFGTTPFGDEMHYAVGEWVLGEFSRYAPRVARASERGLDIVFERGIPPGWQRHNEIKPLTESGLGGKLDAQIESWRTKGTIGRDEPVGILAYDEYGNVFLQPPR